MPEEVEHSAVVARVLWCAFGLSVVAGAVAQRTRLCTMGAVADIVSMGNWARMRMWAATAAVAMLGFNAMVGLEWIEAGKSIYAGTQLLWLSALVGGLMFGFGMVLASGCGTRNLIRLGGGDLKALVVLIVLGLAAFATLRGITAVLRVATLDRVALHFPQGQDLPRLMSPMLGQPAAQLAPWFACGIAALIFGWVVRRPEGRSPAIWIAALGFGGAVVGLWWVSGVLGHLAEDPSTLEEAFLATNSRRMESLSMVAPLGYALDWLMYFSDTTKLLTLGIVNAFGLFTGALAMALANREFRWSGFSGAGDTANHLCGAVLMGIGGTLALGCTIGQGVSGISTLSIGSALVAAACIAGALLGLRYLTWRL